MSEANITTTVLKAFESQFGRQPRLFRAPARVNIIGEHCDYNDGFVMPTNTDLYTVLAISARQDRIVRILAIDIDQMAEIHMDDIQADPDGDWLEYPKGVLSVLMNKGFELKGADIVLSGEIPLGGGLSSSASLETVIAFAMLSCAGHEIDRSHMAQMCKAAENNFVGVACGIMDQYVISLAGKDQAMMLDCRSLEYKATPLPLDAQLLVVNSGVHHRLSEGSLNNRRHECERAVEIINASGLKIDALRDLSLTTLDTCRGVLGSLLYRRSRHVVTEIQRVADAYQAMLANDVATLGKLMLQSHQSLKDDFEVSCSELDKLVDIACNCEGVYGARMVGAGFGGCTISLVAKDRVSDVAAEICKQYRPVIGIDPWYHVVGATDPVQEFKIP
jgi:galactokinase